MIEPRICGNRPLLGGLNVSEFSAQSIPVSPKQNWFIQIKSSQSKTNLFQPNSFLSVQNQLMYPNPLQSGGPSQFISTKSIAVSPKKPFFKQIRYSYTLLVLTMSCDSLDHLLLPLTDSHAILLLAL
jgi:hypothetical protein